MADFGQTIPRPVAQAGDQADAGAPERPRRATLHLKNPPARLLPVAAAVRWKCKPCGTLLEVDPTLADEAEVRCPGCSARLGRAGQFKGDPTAVQGVRARLA